MKRIFFSYQEVVIFNSRLKDVIDAVLAFVKHDVSLSPFSDKRRIDEKNPNFKKWLMNAPRMTIVHIVCGVIPNEEGKKNAEDGIVNIVPNPKEKKVKVIHKDLNSDDVVVIENLLSKLLFDYYDKGIEESRRQREQNVLLAAQYEQQVLKNVSKGLKNATRHGKTDSSR